MSPARKKISEILAAKAGILNADDSVQTAGDIMRSQKADTLPVADNQRLVGVMDDPNPDIQASRYGHDPSQTRVGDAMNPDAAFCFDDQDSDTALKVMNENNLDRLPVVDREMRIVGTLERSDFEGGDSDGKQAGQG